MAVKDHHDCAYKDADGVIICKSEGKDTECPEYSMGVGDDECWYYRTFQYRIGKGGVPIRLGDGGKHMCLNRRVGQRVGFTFMRGCLSCNHRWGKDSD